MKAFWHRLAAAFVTAWLLTAVLGGVARAASSCGDVLSPRAQQPACCSAMKGKDRLTRPGQDCCAEADLQDQRPAVASHAIADVPPAPAVALPAPPSLWLIQVVPVRSPFGRPLARPPDRRPPTGTTVLQI